MAGHYGGNPYKWEGGSNAPHITRYFLARGWILPGETVKDVACANGYGTKMLGMIAKKAIGIDVDEGCIGTAKKDCPANCQFLCRDLDTYDLPVTDVSVSIESAEHVVNLDRFINQLQKTTRRLIIVTVPIGGTTYAYVNEPPGPATEKHDFNNNDHVEKLFATNGWKPQAVFTFGYSHFGVYYKKAPKPLKGGVENWSY